MSVDVLNSYQFINIFLINFLSFITKKFISLRRAYYDVFYCLCSLQFIPHLLYWIEIK